MLDFGVVGTIVLIASCIGSFALARFLSRKRRARKAERDRAAALASQSRQVRRAHERRGKR